MVKYEGLMMSAEKKRCYRGGTSYFNESAWKIVLNYGTIKCVWSNQVTLQITKMHYKIAITKMKTEFMKNNVFIINIQNINTNYDIVSVILR